MDKKPEKNNLILEATTEEFLSKGIDAASMHNIALKAEVSKRTLYKYYPSKEDLYFALIDSILDQVSDMHSFTYNKDQSLEELISSVIDAKIKLTLSESFLKVSKIIFGELLKGRSPSDQQLERMNQSESLFINWIKQAQNDNLLTKELSPDEMANQFHSILKGKIYWPIILGFKSKDNLNLEEIKKNTLDFFVRSFSNK